LATFHTVKGKSMPGAGAASVMVLAISVEV